VNPIDRAISAILDGATADEAIALHLTDAKERTMTDVRKIDLECGCVFGCVACGEGEWEDDAPSFDEREEEEASAKMTREEARREDAIERGEISDDDDDDWDGPPCHYEDDELVEDDRPEVELLGHDGNAFAIIGACQRVARRAGWPEDRIARVRNEMMAGDYDHLIQTAMRYFEVT
jgi:hypothetical protein